MIRLHLRSLYPALLASWSAALFTSQSYGYVLENKSWPDGTVITWEMEMGAPAQPLQDGSATWNQAAAPALTAWNVQMGEVQMNAVMDSSKPVSSGDGVNSASFASSVFGDSFGPGVLAVTYYRYQSGNTLLEADILFNNAQTFESYRGNLQFDSQGKCICDIQRVFLHEVGHALGLNHPDLAQPHQSVTAIMNSVVGNLSTLSTDDIAGIRSLYGPPAHAPSPTPGPSATPPGATTPSRLINISTRMRVGTDSDVLIGGFIIQGDQLKKVILRAIGPSLSANGVAGALQDPKMALYDGEGTLLDSNDNWQESSDAGAIIDSTIAPSDPRESAIVARLGPGNYTVIVSGADNTAGVGLVESYTLDSNASHAANISTRGQVGREENALIGGFIVSGNTAKRIIVRALGPSLAGSGFSDLLADPLVELRDGDGQLIAQNDDWANGGQRDEIIATGIPPNDFREAAVIATIPTGNFTAVVRGADGGQGIGLVEIYDLDQ